MIAFVASFIKYFVILLILVAVSVAGIFTGKILRNRKDAKEMNEASNDK